MPWNDPLLPQSWIQPAQQALEQPKLDQSPMMARLKGFGSGALEGLRNLTRPTDLAGLALTAVPGGAMVKGAGALERAIPGAMDLASMAPEVVEAAQGAKQVMPMAEDVGALQGLLKYNLAKVPTGARAMPGATDLMSEAGRIDPGLAIAGGAAGAGGLYLAKQAMDALKKNAPPAVDQAKEKAKSVNPFSRVTDVLNQQSK